MRYICTWHVYQHFLFDFPFDEMYVRLLFSLSGVLFTCEYTIPQNETVKQDKIREEPENRVGAVCVEYGRD